MDCVPNGTEGFRTRMILAKTRLDTDSTGSVTYDCEPVRIPAACKNVVYFVRTYNKSTNAQLGLTVMTSPDGGPPAQHSTIMTTGALGAPPETIYATTKADTDGQLGEFVMLRITIAGGSGEWATLEVFEQLRPC